MPTRADLVAAILALALHAGLGYELWRIPPGPTRPPSLVEVEFRETPRELPKIVPPPVVGERTPARAPPVPGATAAPRKAVVAKASRPTVAVRHEMASPPPAALPPAPAPAERPVFGFTMDSTVGESPAVPVGDSSGVDAPPGAGPPAGPSKAGAAHGTNAPRATLAITSMPEVDTEACGRAVHYPPEAAALGIEGSVRLRVELDEHGQVLDVRVLSGLGHGLDQEAVEALKHRCRFTPAIASDGRPVPFVIDPYVFHFEIPR